MNQLLKYISLIFLSLFVASCAGDKLREDTLVSGKEGVVRFTINENLRASGNPNITHPTPALDREKAINELYAVVYNTKSGIHYKTFQCTATTTQGEYQFDNQKSGDFFFFLIANPDEDLKKALLAGPTTKDDLGKLVAKQSPGDNNSATNFLMTSDKVDVKVNSKVATNIATSIKLVRVAARFDFFNKIEGLTIDKITFKKRYTESHLFAQVKEMAGLASTDNMEYAGSLFNNGVLTATVYGYETDTRNETYFTLEGSYKGKPIETQEIRLENFAIKRNHLYNIILHELGGGVNPDDPNNQFGKLKYEIKVADWEEGESLTMDEEMVLKPLYVDFAGELPKAPYVNPYLVNSPATIYTTTKLATEVILSVGTYIEAGSITVKGNLPEGSQFTEISGSTTKDPKTGKITKKYKLTFAAKEEFIPLDLVNGTVVEIPEFTKVELEAKNFSGETVKEFTVKHGRFKMPVEYLAEAPLNKTLDGFATDGSDFSQVGYVTGKYYSHDEGNKTPSVIDFKTKEIGGVKYHLAESGYELKSIIPGSHKTTGGCVGNGDNVLPSIDNKLEWIVLPCWVYQAPGGQCYISNFKSDYRTDKAKNVSYALRLKDGGNNIGNLMQTAYKYEWVGDFKPLTGDGKVSSYFRITCRYLGANWNGKVEDIANEAFWQSNNQEDAVRTIYALGRLEYNGNTREYVGENAIIISAKDHDSTHPQYMQIAQLEPQKWTSTVSAIVYHRFPIWLFSDK